MSNWKVMKLSEVATIVGGGTPSSSKSEYFENGNIPWITPKDLSGYNKRYISKGERNITELGLKNSSAKLLPKNTVLLTSRAPIGYVAIASNEISTNQGFKSLVLNNGHIPEFFYYLLKNNVHILESRATGSTFKEISGQILKDTELSIPTPDIQQKIVDILSPLDDKIELNTQINQTLEQIAQALFKSWFVDFDPVRAKVQALSDGLSLEQAELAAMQAISGKTPEELTALSQTQPERYAELAETAKAFPCEMVEVDGVEVPKGWEVKRIDEVIQKIPVGKKYSSKIAFSEGLVPILDQGRSGVIGYHNDKPGVKASIEDPIIVFANHTCYMRLISYDFSAIQNVFAFKGKECNLYWLYLATLGKQEFVEYKGHFPDFLIKEIIVPPEELTELFGKYVKENFSKIFINDRENSNLAKIRDLLLPKLLNGEV
ncbi:restriction endonuclease HindVIIP subunit S [Haemophilus influenzae]|uniref:restriction endonuclease subunit S n=2 Tax=Haemophilus influenzae TaxID=727 RepID=UPI000459D931|nr:restriction endonuclease subunit S [Haemophilus influenzae]KAI97386.1 restriction endonuclease HindVIIP subunit S [Haemophilus influenzae]KAI99603.1 restriction endonuclease HindVIIP subunit S [Haemophilus influenzae]KAI99926.1 restriction endonuclease HindVIIP subunit S [Haemophilus influenzae]MCK9676443.1 restriction endonuclease subunit S [Haemophilus influenzae]RFN75757.1 restriction endonuclease subunit S [Haemophilus influenzae]